MKKYLNIIMALFESYRLKNSKRYQMNMVSKALYYQVKYNDYHFTERIEKVFATEDEISYMILNSIIYKNFFT